MADTTVSYLDAAGTTRSQDIDRISGTDTPYVKAAFGASGTRTSVEAAVGKALPVLPGLASCTHLACAATTNQTNIKAGAGYLRGFVISNALDTGVWLKFHNTAGTPTAGSGVVRSFFANAGMTVCSFPAGINFSTGIGITTISDSAATGGADSDTTVLPTANRVVLEIFWE